MILHIKNMVCARCILAIDNILNELGIEYLNVKLGQVYLKKELKSSIKDKLEENLKLLGFELLENKLSKVVSEIKSIIIEQIHHTNEPLVTNFSTLLSQKLNHDYSYLSRLFSSIEGITIEKFITSQKIEKVKELIFYQELSLSDIAYQLNFSNVSYLSSLFKKETGMTVTEFRGTHNPQLKLIDKI